MNSFRVLFVQLVLAGGSLLAATSTITGPTVSPATISFNAADPDTTPTGGSSTATIQWGMNGNPKGNWTVSVQATSSTLANCPTIPVSAIKVQCASFAPGSGLAGGCSSGSFMLSTSSQIIASGNNQGNGGAGSQSLATLSFTFTDDWKYSASPSCSVQLTYTVNTQ